MRIASLVLAVMAAGCGFPVAAGGQPGGDDAPPPPPDADRDTLPPDEPAPDMPCADGDADGICDAVDACPAGDDRADADNDSVADACDDWPCGAKPAAPGDAVAWNNTFQTRTENVTLSDVRLDGMQRKFLVVTPSQFFDVLVEYSIHDCICSNANCIDQIQVGLWPGEDTECVYNDNPGGNNPSTCTVPSTGTGDTARLQAPSTRGAFGIRFRRANGASNFCNNSPNWWEPPTPAETIAYVCVN